jgi:hypothetical protein
MRIDLLKKLENLKFEETEYGFKLVGFKETIHPLAICAKLKYGKKLKSKRLMKKYAKVFLKDVIEDFVRRYNANKEKSSTTDNDL